MHVYIYDNFLGKSHYNKITNKIETRLTDLDLNGKIVRLNNLKNSDKAIEEEIKKGAKTVVVVGNDETLNKVLNILTNENLNFFIKNIVIAFIPVANSSLGNSLGLNNYQQACDILLARRLKNIYLAKCGNYYFLSNIRINGENVEITINNEYKIILPKNKTAYIINIPGKKLLNKMTNIREFNEKKLYLFIEDNKKSYSFIPIDNIKIKKQENLNLTLDNCCFCNPPSEINLSNKSIRFIVGKDRAF